MSSQTYVLNICDKCGAEEKPAREGEVLGPEIQQHEVSVDGKIRYAEICTECWPKVTFVELMEIGRKRKT